MQQQKNIVIVGGGIAGVKLALELRNNDNFKVTLISPHDALEYHGALYRSATGRSPLEVVLPFNEIFKDSNNIDVVSDYMTELRAQTKDIKCLSGRVYAYDALVLALGYEVDYFGIKGMREYPESIYNIYDTIRLRNRLRDIFIERENKATSIVVVGAGPVGVELASDLDTFAEIVANAHSISQSRPKVTIIERADRVLPVLSREVSQIANDRLNFIGVEVKTGMRVKSCTPKHVYFDDDTHMRADMIVWTAGNRANSFFERYPDIFSLDGRKRVVVGEFMQANSPDIYVIGDSASTTYSGLAQTAISDAIQLSDNFKCFVDGRQLRHYDPSEPVYVVPIGKDWAVAQQGDEIKVGADGWKIRREADMFILSSFLPQELAQSHWEKAFKVAQT